MAGKRIEYYDVAKGVLICLVIITHAYARVLSTTDSPNATISLLRDFQWLFTSFYMPAFFIVSGLCSNFDKDFKPFLIRNFRTLIIPAVFFDLFFFTLPHVLIDSSPLSFELVGFLKRALAFGGVFWFLPCMFVSRIIYWILHNYTKDIVRWGILLVLVVCGFTLNHYHLYPQKWWYAIQVFDLTLFLGIGQLLKNTKIEKDVFYRIGTAVYLVILAIVLAAKLPLPSVYYYYNINEWWQLPIHVLVSIAGTMFVLWICQMIKSNRFLEYLGRGTVVVYGINELFLRIILEPLGIRIDDVGILQSLVMFVILLMVVIALCAWAIRIFNMKYLRFIIGKS